MGKLTNEAMLALMVYQCSTGKSHNIYITTQFFKPNKVHCLALIIAQQTIGNNLQQNLVC